MPVNFFSSIFANAPMPVVVCRDGKTGRIVHANVGARILLDPLWINEDEHPQGEERYLKDVLHFINPNSYDTLMRLLEDFGCVEDFQGEIYDYAGHVSSISISTNMIEFSGECYFILYIYTRNHGAGENRNLGPLFDADRITSLLFHITNNADNVDEAINKMLSVAGSHINVSRAYVFERAENNCINNTYEWCVQGVEPVMKNLQCLNRDEYEYSDTLLSSGLYIANDVKNMPEADRKTLEAQGIKSLALLPVYQGLKQLGYVGFDDCVKCRSWSREEIRLLQNVATLISSLLIRRNEEKKVSRSLKILQIVSDTIDHATYANTLDTYEIVFVNQTLASSVNRKAEDLIGEKCWQALHQNKTGPCEFCPIPKMMDENGKILSNTHRGEIQNSKDNRWYLIKDSIIQWIDGKNVHIQTALDITDQKQHEKQLEHIASTDKMTGAFNREWGYKIIGDMRADADIVPQPISLVFLDLDYLKLTNDKYGHEAGDDMIIRVANAIRAGIRQSDIICRWGGDEFIVLLKCTVKVAKWLMETIQAKLDDFNKTGEKPYKLSFSYGIKDLTADPSATVDAIISEADKLMYEQKTLKQEPHRD